MITRSTLLPLEYGVFKISYHKFASGVCLSITYGDIHTKTPVVRIHSSCLFGEALHGLDCDCRQQLDSTLEAASRHGSGVVVYQFAEGRGIGLEEKIHALEIQRIHGLDTVEAFRTMGLPSDMRKYDIPIKALDELHIPRTVIFASQNPHKIKAMEEAGYTIHEVTPPKIEVTLHNRPELFAKKHKLGYLISNL